MTDLETMLLNWLPVGTVTEEDAASPNQSQDSAEGCFPCGILTHTMDQCQTLDESFPFLPTGWQAERIGDQFILGPGPQAGPRARVGRPVVEKDIPGPAVPCHVGTAQLVETVNNRIRSVGRAVRQPYADSDKSDNDGLYAEEHDSRVQQVSLRNDWLTQTADSESEVEYIEPDSTPLKMKTMAKQLLCPPVVAQTRPMEGSNPASPRRLRRGRDVLTEDGAVAVDTREVSAASDTVVLLGR